MTVMKGQLTVHTAVKVEPLGGASGAVPQGAGSGGAQTSARPERVWPWALDEPAPEAA